MDKFTSPQPAPWGPGTVLRFVGGKDGAMSGFTDDNGDTVWSHQHGVIYTVIESHDPYGVDRYRDEETGELVTQLLHGWSALRSELDPGGRHVKVIDAESAGDYEIMK